MARFLSKRKVVRRRPVKRRAVGRRRLPKRGVLRRTRRGIRRRRVYGRRRGAIVASRSPAICLTTLVNKFTQTYSDTLSATNPFPTIRELDLDSQMLPVNSTGGTTSAGNELAISIMNRYRQTKLVSIHVKVNNYRVIKQNRSVCPAITTPAVPAIQQVTTTELPVAGLFSYKKNNTGNFYTSGTEALTAVEEVFKHRRMTRTSKISYSHKLPSYKMDGISGYVNLGLNNPPISFPAYQERYGANKFINVSGTPVPRFHSMNLFLKPDTPYGTSVYASILEDCVLSQEMDVEIKTVWSNSIPYVLPGTV
uniref:Capsid protein n=1 Tax=Tarsiger cyanurus CRESS-DNA-virus sp. TaxID=2815060 RepID=A0A8A4XC84_9VIRU|nr:MAG: hypothetical protein [Tarsiger cyanurus CRESS-DNA-virus sp.]